MNLNWTDDNRRKAIKLYLNADPNSRNTTDIVRHVAKEMGTSPNSVRCILHIHKVYIKKEIIKIDLK